MMKESDVFKFRVNLSDLFEIETDLFGIDENKSDQAQAMRVRRGQETRFKQPGYPKADLKARSDNQSWHYEV